MQIKKGQKGGPVHDTDNPAKSAVPSRIKSRHAIAECAKVLWHLRAILALLVMLFLIFSVTMYYVGGAVNVVTRNHSSLGQTFYFCLVTALTIGYGDVVPTTTIGRIVAVLLGLLGVLITGLVSASAVYAIQVAAQRAGIITRHE